MSTLGERLRQEREKHGWSQVFVAKKLGLKRSSTYANWEYDLREPDLEMINKMAELYEVDANFLTGMKGHTLSKLHLLDDEKLEKQIKIAEEIY
ncbi:helix-turn-helix domain-containing protein, partial [Paenibacillus polymyxa]